MQQSLTVDRGFTQEKSTASKRFVEEGFAADKSFVVFLLAMIVLFILCGMIANPGSFVSPDYQTFW